MLCSTMGKIIATLASKNFTHALISLILNKALFQPTKTIHQWTPELITSKTIFCLVTVE